MRKREDLPFHKIFYSFAAFILVLTFDDVEISLTGVDTRLDPVTVDMFLEHVDPADHPEVKASLKDTLENDSEYAIRFPFIRPDGEKIWLAAGFLGFRIGFKV